MSPTNRRSPGPISDLEQEQRTLHQILPNQAHWFMTSDGRSPLSVSRDEFEFSVAHNRLMFSCWTESGSRTGRVTSGRWSDDKLALEVSRRMGAETSRIELVPGARLPRQVCHRSISN